MSGIQYTLDAERIVTLTLDLPGSANVINSAYLEAMDATLARLEAERDSYDGVVLTSAKSTFFAGADLKDILRFGPDDGQAVFDWVERLKRQLRRLEKLGKPVVAAIGGAALGGGWEIALACHARVALKSSKVKLGLPEVTLGLLPGGGGVTKMVRLLGLQGAFPYLVEGKLMSPEDAADVGLVQALADTPQALLAEARKLVQAIPEAVQPWDDPEWRIPGGTPSSPKLAPILAGAPAMLTAKTHRCYPAPEAILCCAVEGAQVDFETAMRIESRYFARLATGPVARSMVKTFFFAMNEVKAGKSRPADIPFARFNKVGVLGAGMMGAGIAYANAVKGIPVVLKDVTEEQAAKGKLYTEKLLKKRVALGKMTSEKRDAALALITPTERAADLDGCDLIIEAVFENRDLKAKVVQEAEPMLVPDAVIASNTSTLPITGLATATKQPENFIGLHFFSPVDKMQLVEIIKGKATSAETLARAYDYVQLIGKTPIVVNDSRGFYTSRVFATFVNEGVAMLGEGVPAALIENVAVQAGFPVGPLAVLDEVSLTLVLKITDQTIADFAAEGRDYVPHPAEAVIRKMALELQRAGRAAGAGFYEYPEGGSKRLWSGLTEHFGKPGTTLAPEEIRDRLLYIMAVESQRCLAENVIETARDGNVGSIFGIGYPAWTGGTLEFAAQVGIESFQARANALADRYGERFRWTGITRTE